MSIHVNESAVRTLAIGFVVLLAITLLFKNGSIQINIVYVNSRSNEISPDSIQNTHDELASKPFQSNSLLWNNQDNHAQMGVPEKSNPNIFSKKNEATDTEKKSDEAEASIEKLKYVPVTCDGCFRRAFKTLISPHSVCTDRKSSPDIVAMVLSTPHHPQERTAFRQTWLQV